MKQVVKPILGVQVALVLGVLGGGFSVTEAATLGAVTAAVMCGLAFLKER